MLVAVAVEPEKAHVVEHVNADVALESANVELVGWSVEPEKAQALDAHAVESGPGCGVTPI